MPIMALPLGREKALPGIPADVDTSRTVEADEGLWLVPSSKVANTNKELPSIRIENMLSEEEMSRLHELWNGAGLRARAHRRRQRGQDPTLRRIPAPISIPELASIPPTPSSSPDPSIPTMTPPATVTRKRWGFLSAKPFSEAQEVEKTTPNTLEKLRAMAQDRLKKKLRYTKSAPDLGDLATPLERGVTLQPAAPTSTEAVPKDVEASSSRLLMSPGELTTPETVLQPEDVDENAIYFTIDPNWHASQGSVQFQFITPIPDSPTSSERPDSPLVHRHHSLDQLSFAAQEAIKALASAATEFPEVYPSNKVLHPIDELHAYLEL